MSIAKKLAYMPKARNRASETKALVAEVTQKNWITVIISLYMDLTCRKCLYCNIEIHLLHIGT